MERGVEKQLYTGKLGWGKGWEGTPHSTSLRTSPQSTPPSPAPNPQPLGVNAQTPLALGTTPALRHTHTTQTVSHAQRERVSHPQRIFYPVEGRVPMKWWILVKLHSPSVTPDCTRHAYL